MLSICHTSPGTWKHGDMEIQATVFNGTGDMECTQGRHSRTDKVKSSHLYLYSAFNNTDCVKALNSIKLEDRVSVMYNNKIKHSIFS